MASGRRTVSKKPGPPKRKSTRSESYNHRTLERNVLVVALARIAVAVRVAITIGVPIGIAFGEDPGVASV